MGKTIREAVPPSRRCPIKFGLKGAPDIVGFDRVRITPEMMGKILPVAVAVEVKRPGQRAKPHQEAFHDALPKNGVPIVVATSPDGIAEALREKIAS